MTEVDQPKGYHQMMVEATTTVKDKAQTPVNYFSTISVATGVIAGLIGSIAIIVVISALTVTASMEAWLAPRFIASTVLGDAAWSGVFPIVFGTGLHLITGSLYGAIFAFALPRLPRPFWIVAGLIYSMGLWAIAAFILPLLSETSMMNDQLYVNALVIAHLIFGITLGLAGSFFGANESE